jgi:hypothetical protein
MTHKKVNSLFYFEAKDPDPVYMQFGIQITIVPKHFYDTEGYMYDEHISTLLEVLGGKAPDYMGEECEGTFSAESKTLEEVIKDLKDLGFEEKVFSF